MRYRPFVVYCAIAFAVFLMWSSSVSTPTWAAVSTAAPVVGVLTSSANPSTYGQSVIFTLKQDPRFAGSAIGKVTFYDGATPQQTIAFTNGVATFTTSSLTPGTHTITAILNGTSARLTQTVIRPSLNVGAGKSMPGGPIHASGSRSEQKPQFDHSCRTSTQAFVYGNNYVTQPVTIYAVMNMQQDCDGQNFNYYFCQGNVNFYDYSGGEKTLLGTGSPVGGNNPCSRMFTTSSLPAGNHVIVADFEGNPDYSPSVGHFTLSISTWSTTTGLVSTPNPSIYGEVVTFSVTVVSSLGNTPTGRVKFFNGASVLGTVTLDSNGMASLSAKHLPAGTDAITVEYLGDSLSAKSTSAVLNQVVNAASK